MPNRERTEWRNQLTLNLAREDVYQYLLKSMSDLLANHNIKLLNGTAIGINAPGIERIPVLNTSKFVPLGGWTW